MSMDQISENAVISLSSTAKSATFSTGVKKVYVTSDTDCYVAFDQNIPTVGGGFLVKAGVTGQEFEFESGGPLQVWGIGTSGKLYILVIR